MENPSYRRLWIAFALVVLLSFAVLGGYGFRIAAMAPPIPETVRIVAGNAPGGEGTSLWFKLGLLTGHSFVKEVPEVPAGQLTPERESAGAA